MFQQILRTSTLGQHSSYGMYMYQIFHISSFRNEYLLVFNDKRIFAAVFYQTYIVQVNAAIGYGEILMNRVVMQEMNILFIQVRNRKEQRYNATNTTYHQ